MVVLIPSAKLIPEELQNIGKLPPVFYPLNKGPYLTIFLTI